MHPIKVLYKKWKFSVRFPLSSQRRYTRWWLASLQQDYLLKKPLPWLCFEAIEFVKSYLSEGMRVFEYGSGGSTLFWLEYGAQLTSVEHDRTWYQRLKGHIDFSKAIDYRLVPPEHAIHKDLDFSDPNAYASKLPEFSGFTFKSYCSQIDEFPDEYFDIVLVDGRVRPSCIKHSHKKVKEGGILILDNSDRSYYLERTSDFLCDYQHNHFFGATPNVYQFSTTSVFVRRTSE